MKYNGIFTDRESVAKEFDVDLAMFPAEGEILFAWYENEDYSGSAFVLFKKDGKLYEVNGSHCSCMGLEEQWEPEETTKEALRMRKFEFDSPLLQEILK